MHPTEASLISTIAVSLSCAVVFGFIAVKLRLPAIIGYLAAGVVVGPFTPGYVANMRLEEDLAEIGVMLLMFGVGMHFSLRDLLAVRKIAIGGAAAQIIVALLMSLALTHFWGWSCGAGARDGACALGRQHGRFPSRDGERGMVQSDAGKIAVGWLVVEDLFTVLILVLLPVLAGVLGGHGPADGSATAGLGFKLYLMLAKLVVFVGLMLVIGKRVLPWLLACVTRTGSRELSILATATVAIGLAYGATELFGVSFALGAFLAGLVISRSHETRHAADDLRPLQDIFGVLFFVSVGMLFDPGVLHRRPMAVVEVLAIIVVGKPLATYAIVRLMRYPNATALIMAAGLGQIGEFSFILATMGEQLGLIPMAGRNLILAGAIGSISLNAVAFRVADRLKKKSIKLSADGVVLSQPSSASA